MEAPTSRVDTFTLDFTDILNRVNRKFEIIHATWSEDKSFEVKFRTEMEKTSDDYNTLCDDWVDTFSEVTNTVWAKKTSNTGPKVKFRKQYQCWTHGGKVVQKELLFDARKCKGTLDIKVFSDNNPSTRRKNKFIRLGLNVVVKINFVHLHKVDTKERFAFFVHNCKAQPKEPKQTPMDNKRLPQLVAEMVQKGLNSSIPSTIQNISKISYVNPLNITQQHALKFINEKELEEKNSNDLPIILQSDVTTSNLMLRNDGPFIQEAQQINNVPTLQVVQNIPLQNFNGLKLEFQPNLEHFAQVVVSDSSMNEPLLMCQPLMFDNMQALPHFVQLNSRSLCNRNQGQFLQ